jgi:UDP-glucose 4-epimerase
MPVTHLDRLLVTGSTGTLGYNILRQLGASYPDSRVMALNRTPGCDLFADLPNVSVAQVDMLDTQKLCEVVRDFRPNAVVHAAASGVRPSSIGYFELVDLNVSATLHLFRATCNIPGCHFVNISTGLVYGQQERPCRESDAVNTLHPYGASKAAADCLLRAPSGWLPRRPARRRSREAACRRTCRRACLLWRREAGTGRGGRRRREGR